MPTALAAVVASHVDSSIASGAKTVNDFHRALYGYRDNSPLYPATPFDCGYGRGYTAGGPGTYADLLIFGTAPGEYDNCEIVWDQYVRKSNISQDTCAQYITDLIAGTEHLDLWLESSQHNLPHPKAMFLCAVESMGMLPGLDFEAD